MRNPEVYSASEIATWHVSEEYEPGKWRPARCCAWHGLNLRYRLRLAWWVFTGRCDVLRWGEASGTWSNDHANYRDITEKGFVRAGKLVKPEGPK